MASEPLFGPHQLDDTVFELLDPVHELSSVGRRKLSAKSRGLLLEPGEQLFSRDWEWHLLYLLDGELERGYPGRAPEVLSEHHPQVCRPLFPDPKQRHAALTAREPCELIAFDRRLFDLLREEESAQGAEIDFIETNTAESALFQRLFEDYSRGALEIPSLPDVSQNIRRVLEMGDGEERQVVRLVGADPALAARVVRAASKLAGNVRSIADGVRILGLARVRDLALTQALERIYDARSPAIRTRLRRTYDHSIRVAAFSFVLARSVEGVDSDQALLAGLLHDVGMFPILCAADAHLEDIGDGSELDAVVWKLHGLVGGLVLEQWGFDPVVREVAEHCDDWRRNPGPEPDCCDVVLVAQLHSFIGTDRMKGLPQFATVPAFRKLAGEVPAPQFSLRVFREGRQEIATMERLFAG